MTDNTSKPEYRNVSQAERVFRKFGGARPLAKAIGRDPSAVYRWDYPTEEGGTGGVIPSSTLPLVLKAARVHGVLLTADDLSPFPTREKVEAQS